MIRKGCNVPKERRKHASPVHQGPCALARSAGWAALGDISASATSACATFAWDSGSACCWGRQLGAGAGGGPPSLANLSSPTPLAGAVTPSWRQLSSGAYVNATTGAADAFTCGIQADGSGWCFGSDASGLGLLGAGAPGGSLEPRQLAVAGPWNSISTGSGFSCALRAVGGSAYCFGERSLCKTGGTANAEQQGFGGKQRLHGPSKAPP